MVSRTLGSADTRRTLTSRIVLEWFRQTGTRAGATGILRGGAEIVSVERFEVVVDETA
jgi:hypothetical protein